MKPPDNVIEQLHFFSFCCGLLLSKLGQSTQDSDLPVKALIVLSIPKY